MKISISEDFSKLLFSDEEAVEVVSLAEGAAEDVGNGKPSRVLAMVGNGHPAESIQIVDTRNGAVYGIQG